MTPSHYYVHQNKMCIRPRMANAGTKEAVMVAFLGSEKACDKVPNKQFMAKLRILRLEGRLKPRIILQSLDSGCTFAYPFRKMNKLISAGITDGNIVNAEWVVKRQGLVYRLEMIGYCYD